MLDAQRLSRRTCNQPFTSNLSCVGRQFFFVLCASVTFPLTTHQDERFMTVRGGLDEQLLRSKLYRASSIVVTGHDETGLHKGKLRTIKTK
ncbi:hypothetical protein INR49_024592 [Caranx melampygus]|nr:hypothetical protein INR49_024592 [Caranx melampygus]